MRSRGDSPACYAYKAPAYDAAGRAPLLRGAAGWMTPELRPLADVLVGICVRELTARRTGKKKAREPLIQANGLQRDVPNDSAKKVLAAPSNQR